MSTKSKSIDRAKIDIYATLHKNYWTTRIALIVCGVVTLGSVALVAWHYQRSSKLLYSISSNEKLIPLELMEQKEADEIMRKAHIELFLRSFYEYDQWNYEQHIEKALWLIDQSGKDLYFFYRDRGHFNRILQTGSSQQITEIQSAINAKGEFAVEAIVVIHQPGEENESSYLLKAQGVLKEVSRNYPLNPYGYLILNYSETSKQQL